MNSQNPSSKFSDPAERAAASFKPDVAADIDTPADELIEGLLVSMRRMPIVRLPTTLLEFQLAVKDIMARAVMDSEGLGGALEEMRRRDISAAGQEAVMQTLALVMDNPDGHKLAADSIAFAAGIHSLQEGKSQTELAEESGVGRAAVSKRVTAAQRQLGLPTSRGMKDMEAQEAYQERAHAQHGTELKEAAKEARLLAAAVKRLTAWLVRFLPDLKEATDGREAAQMLAALFPALAQAMLGVELLNREAV